MTDSYKLEGFDWLPVGSWTVDNLIGPYLKNQGMCKICDKYIDRTDLEHHVKKHLKEYERLNKKKRRVSAEKRKETLRLAREKRKNKKDREKLERDYQEGELDE